MKNNLPNWKKFSNLLKTGVKAGELGFIGKDGDVSRVNARYRIAKSFTNIKLETFSDNTTLGYEGLLKVFLTYSALESYVRIISLEQSPSIPNEAIKFIDTEEAKNISLKILKLDDKKKFYTFIKKYVERDNIKENINKFYAGEEYNIVYLLSGIRHIFGHGYLSASSNKITPKKVNKICLLLSDFILKQIGNDFAKRIK